MPPKKGKKSAKEGEQPPSFLIARQLDQEKIHFLTTRIDGLLSSNTELRTTSSKNEKDTHDIVLYFQREIEMKDDIIARLNEELVKRETQLKFEVERIRKKADSDVYEVQTNTSTTIDALKARLEDAESELALVDAYRNEKNQHVAALSALQSAKMELETQLTETVDKQERKFLEEKAQMYKDMEVEKRAFKEQAMVEARSEMGREVQKVFKENMRIQEEIKFHRMMADELLTEKKQVETSLGEVRRELQILRDNEESYLKQGLTRAKEIKALRERVEQLEKQQIVNVERFKARTKELQSNVFKELDDAMLDAAGLRRLIKIKNKELRTMKTLSATILSQRNDIEQFFLEALAEVRDHVKAQRKKERLEVAATRSLQWTRQSAASQGMQKGSLPSIKGTGSINLETRGESGLPINPEEKVLIRDLSWSDKELVLRVLFAKINGQQKMVDHAVGHAAKKPSTALPSSPTNRAVFVSEGLDLPEGEAEIFQKNFEMFGASRDGLDDDSAVYDDGADLDEDALMKGPGGDD